jgi:LDH2 family malate/lactate/ureidoglycolate dehydrogenase
VLIGYAELTNLCEQILRGFGVPPGEAATQSWALVEADARDHPSHGVQRLTTIVDRIRAGLVVTPAQIAAEWATPAALRIDGGRGLGPVVALRAVEMIGARSAETGIAVATISNSNHVGMLSLYAERLARLGRVCIAMSTSEALVHPWGGRQAMLGTNPIAIGTPNGEEPVIVDMATSAVSMGRILSHADRGVALSDGWAIDEYGYATTDPIAAVSGALAPFGGAKGYALGAGVEVLVGILTNSALGRDVVGTLDAQHVCNKGDVLIAIDPKVFGDAPNDALANFTAALRSSPAVDPAVPVAVPGDRSRARYAHRRATGIDVATTVLDRLQALQAGELMTDSTDQASRQTP